MKSKKFTIFQKLLIAPLLAIILFTFYIYYIYIQHQTSKKYIESIKELHYPIIKIANENIILLNNIIKSFKDAVGAQEKEWLKNAEKDKNYILDNLQKLKILDVAKKNIKEINILEHNLKNYYNNSITLSLLMIDNDNYKKIENLTPKMIDSLDIVEKSFNNFQDEHYKTFVKQIEMTTQHGKTIIIFGALLGIVSLLFIILITLKISFSTKKTLNDLLISVKNIADGNPDFSKRIKQESSDEIGLLVEQFNRFTNKLHDDYDELSTANKKLEYMANKDFLTGTNNRGNFFRLGEKFFVANKSENLYIAMLDIDKFKNLNDTYGHKIGDLALIEFVNSIESQLNEEDVFGRLGGEEFALIFKSETKDAAIKKLEDIRKAIESIVLTFENNSLSFTVSIGLVNKNLGENIDSVLEKADKELYNAKSTGRNNLKFRVN